MTKTAKARRAETLTQAQPVIKMTNKRELRVCFKSSRAISTIQKMPNGKYVVVQVYDEEVFEFDKYSQAKQKAVNAPMLPRSGQEASELVERTLMQVTQPGERRDSSEVGLEVHHKAGRAVSTIQKMPDGRWQVVMLYEEKVSDFEQLDKAEQVASEAAMKQAPRTTKDAA